MIDAVNTVNVNMYACIRRWSSDWLLCREVEFDVVVFLKLRRPNYDMALLI